MKEVLIVKDLIKLLLDYNPYAEVYLNFDGSPIGLSKSDICYSGGGDPFIFGKRPVIFSKRPVIFDRRPVIFGLGS